MARGRTRTGGRLLVVVATAVAGAFAVVGFGLALLLEVHGFGSPRDTGPRTVYLLGCGTGVLLGVVVPGVLAWWLLPRGRRWVGFAAAALATAALVVVLGII